ncbi:MAG: HNH endonuclease [Planctomycetes bacterium]|nr:HNH endonuclease [Planctomycetota bacterium]
MNASTRSLVRLRAAHRCEYCRLNEEDLPLFPFHVEHIIAKKHGGTDDPDNLAWSCHNCNLAKSSNLSGRDPDTGGVVVLFNPRRQRWKRHFHWIGPKLLGRTACGRATIAVLNINAPHRIDLRNLLITADLFPPE